MALKRQEPPQHRPCFRTASLSRPQQLGGLLKLLIDQDVEVGRWTRRDRQHTLW